MSSDTGLPELESLLDPGETSGLFFSALQMYAWGEAYNSMEEAVELMKRPPVRNGHSRQSREKRIKQCIADVDRWTDVALGKELLPDDVYEDPDAAYIKPLVTVMHEEGELVDIDGFRRNMYRLDEVSEDY